MYYPKETIFTLGYASAEEFAEAYIKQHGNCCIRFTDDGGVFADYDYNTAPGLASYVCYFDKGVEI